MSSSKKSFSANELCNYLKANLIGQTDMSITGPEQIEMAGPEHITFIGHQKYLPLWESSKASVAIVNKNLGLTDPGENRAFIEVPNADLAMAQLLEMFLPEAPDLGQGVHPSAYVHPGAVLEDNVTVGANSYVGAGVTIGKGSVLYPNVTLLDGAMLGQNVTIKSGSVVSERCEIGDHSILQANVSVGSDGFGYRPAPDGRSIVKISHIGNVIIGKYVEIGSASCIDRGKFSSTVIGDGTKIDNLVQIGHNCKIGRSCMIAGCCGISGSVTIGDGVIMAGQVAVKDHVTIGNGVTVGGKSGIINDIPDGQTILGFPAVEAKQTLKQWAMIRKMTRS